MAAPCMLSEPCKAWLGSLVKQSIESAFAREHASCPEPGEDLSEEERALLQRNLGCFVTLTLNGMLRGCIGSIVGYEPLYQNVWRMAQSAAFQDPRFPALTEKEWKQCHAEISVLSAAEPCPDPEKIIVGKHGLILQYAGRTGVFLPQVPVEQGWDRGLFLEHLCQKAGVPRGSWKAPGARLFWYEAFVFPVTMT